MAVKTKKAAKKKPAPRKKPAAKKKGKRKKKNVVLFIPKPEQQERRRVGLDTRKRVLAWPCLGRTANRSAASPLRLAPPLEVAWRKKLRAAAVAAPIVSEDGILYAADREGELRAFDAETGEEHFRFNTDPILGASPAWPLVVQKIVPGDRVPVSSAPAVHDWHLLFGDDEGIFYCVRRGDFEVIWRKAAPLSLGARSGQAYQAPVTASGTIVTLDADGNLYAANAQNGTTLYARFLRGKPVAPPVVSGGMVIAAVKPLYPGEPSRLHAIDLAKGDRRWVADLRIVPGRALAATHERVFVGGEGGCALVALATGELLGTLEASVTGPIAQEGGRFYVPVAGAVACFSPTEPLWSTPEAVLPGTGVALSGDVVWAASKKGLL